MKKFTFSILFCLTAALAYGQGISEVVRMSTGEPISTARVAGVGGSFGAMGGDLGVLSINPAGLGDYRKAEITFSPGFSSVSTNAYLNELPENALTRDENSLLSINNLGIVFTGSPRQSDFNTSNFAISLNRLASYTEFFEYEGFTQGSITERFKELANGRTPESLDDFEAYPAYFTSAIFDDDEDLQYDSDISDLAFVDKMQTVNREGRMSELNIAWGGKYNENLNVGVGLGIPIVSFTETKVYTEWDPTDQIELFNSLEYVEQLNTSGTGINLKVGAQYTFKFLRLGASLQSPSLISLEDEYETEMVYDFTLVSSPEPYISPLGSFDYRVTTPWKTNISVGGLFRLGDELNAFVNADLEYQDYSVGKLDYRGNDTELENEVNNDIALQLTNGANIRLGGELAYKKVRVRAGTAFNASAYDLDEGFSSAYSLGGGLRGDKFFLDVAYRIRNTEAGYLPYRVLDIERNQVVTTEQRISNLIFTAGFKF